MPEKYVRRDGVPILLRHTGASSLPDDPPRRDGPGPIVCLHDAGLQSSFFLDLLGALASGRSGACALAFDLPGHGRSGCLDALPSIEVMSDCARGVADWCRSERPILVGHGMGALVALAWAQTAAKGALGGLVLCGVGAALGIRDEAITAMREVTLGRAPRPFDPRRLAPGGPQELMRRAWLESIQTDPRATLVDLEASQRFARAFAQSAKTEKERTAGGTGVRPDSLAGLRVLVVAGEHEAEQDRSAAEALSARLAGRFVLIPQAAHHVPLEQPQALAREILALAEAA